MDKKTLVFNKLHELITSGYFRQREFLTERDIAEMLKVSRTPVREAFNRLEQNGIIIDAGKKGMMIPEFPSEKVKELYLVREYIEGLAARIVAEKRDEETITSLKENLKLAKKYAQENNKKEQALINGRFHQIIGNSTDNLYVINIFKSFQSSINLMRSTSLSIEGRLMSNVKEHTLIVQAIENGDGDLAEKHARNHVRNSLKNVLLVLELTEAEKINLDIYS